MTTFPEMQSNRSKGIANAQEIYRKYRCEGRCFDDINKIIEVIRVVRWRSVHLSLFLITPMTTFCL
jgi:hypothetical protein